MKLFGYINLITGIVIGLIAAPLALLLIFVLAPIVMLAGAVSELKSLFVQYPKEVVAMMQTAFKISNTGLKRIRGEAK